MYDMLDFKNYNKEINNITFTDYYYRLMLIALSVFEWKNLPNNINERWIEKYLFSHGECMFFKDPTYGLMVSKITKTEVNRYDEPVYLTPVATNYDNVRFYKNGEEAVLIKNNDLSIPSKLTVEQYAYRLADITRTIDVNVHAQKTPILIKCSDKQLMSLKNIYNQYDGNKPAIFGDKGLGEGLFEVLNTNAPYVADKLQLLKHAIWNECMTFLGINNANQDKKERLVDDEVQANNQQVRICFEAMLKARKSACEEINRLFGTNISVEARIDLEAYIMASEDGSEEGSESEVA